MNAKILMVLRLLLGLLLLVFGLNKFLNFMPKPVSLPDDVLTYMKGLTLTKTIILVGIIEVVAGLAFILNKYGALMALILMSISINVLLFHITLFPNGIAPALVLLSLNILMLYNYRGKYKALLEG